MQNAVNKPGNPWPPLLRRGLKRIIPNSVYRKYVGRHEDESFRIWTELSQAVGPNDAILDIGAFKGEFALASRRVNALAAIFAFEPNPISAADLRAPCKAANVELVEAAVADVCGTLSFLCTGAGSRLEGNANVQGDEELRIVKSVTLDAWVEERGVRPALIKIDTEGAEAAIFRHAQKVLTTYNPTIICEVLDDNAGKEVMAALPSNYRYFYINENGGVFREERIWRRRWRDHNWLLKPEK